MINDPTWPVEWKQITPFLLWQDYMATGTNDLAVAFEAQAYDRTMIGFKDATGLLDTKKMGRHIVSSVPSLPVPVAGRVLRGAAAADKDDHDDCHVDDGADLLQVDWMPDARETDETVARGEYSNSNHTSVSNAFGAHGLEREFHRSLTSRSTCVCSAVPLVNCSHRATDLLLLLLLFPLVPLPLLLLILLLLLTIQLVLVLVLVPVPRLLLLLLLLLPPLLLRVLTAVAAGAARCGSVLATMLKNSTIAATGAALKAEIVKQMWNGTAFCDGPCNDVAGASKMMSNMFTLCASAPSGRHARAPVPSAAIQIAAC